MGMYTELVFKGFLKDNLPKEVREVLHYLFDDDENSECWTRGNDWAKIKEKYPEKVFFSNDDIQKEFWRPTIDHNFFRCPWWRDIANSSSYYHVPQSFKCLQKDRYIFTRCDLKNYHGVIEEFVEWSKPYLDMEEGSCIGWYWYEEYAKPTLLYV